MDLRPTALVQNFNVIAIEDLKIKNMVNCLLTSTPWGDYLHRDPPPDLGVRR